MSCLENLPLRRGAVIIIGGNSAHTLAKRLAHIARQRWRRLRVSIHSPERTPDPKALTLFVPSYNSEINRWLDKSGISGVINALDESRFSYVDAVSGETTRYTLPPLPRAVNELIRELGYA
jgi:hypothetical protein